MGHVYGTSTAVGRHSMDLVSGRSRTNNCPEKKNRVQRPARNRRHYQCIENFHSRFHWSEDGLSESDPLSTLENISTPVSRTQTTLPVCPVHLAITLPVSMFHNFTAPSLSAIHFLPVWRQCYSIHCTVSVPPVVSYMLPALQNPYSQ